ncbi:MAG: hypothetical protein ACK2T7_03640, partial [Anaerolineales bacterium]
YSEFEVPAPQYPLWVSNSTMVVFLGEYEGKPVIYGSSIPGPRPLVLAMDLWSPNSETPLLLVNP